MKPVALLLLLCLLGACSSETVEEKVNRKLEEALGKAAESVSGVEVNSEQMKEVFQNASNELDSLNLISTTEVIGFRELKELMPVSALGLSRSKHIGETSGLLGVKFSQAEATYGEGDRSIEAQLIDSGGAGVLLLSLGAFANLNIDKETETGSQRTYQLDGYPAFEEYSTVDGRTTSALKVLVKKRFIVSLEGRGVTAAELAAVFSDFKLSELPESTSK